MLTSSPNSDKRLIIMVSAFGCVRYLRSYDDEDDTPWFTDVRLKALCFDSFEEANVIAAKLEHSPKWGSLQFFCVYILPASKQYRDDAVGLTCKKYNDAKDNARYFARKNE